MVERKSVCPTNRQQRRAPAGLLLSAPRVGDIDRRYSAARRSATEHRLAVAAKTSVSKSYACFIAYAGIKCTFQCTMFRYLPRSRTVALKCRFTLPDSTLVDFKSHSLCSLAAQ